MVAENSMSAVITELFKAEVRDKLFGEYWPRLLQCLDECDDELLWFRPNEQSNSIGNLVLHLEGNVRQWLVHGVGGKADTRKRSEEFDHHNNCPRAELLQKLERLKADVLAVLEKVDVSKLAESRIIQGFDTSVLGALFHVTEHFSYHLGQISYIVKANKNIDLGYFADRNLG